MEYKIKDVIFNNGIVNLYRFLQDRDYGLKFELKNSSFILEIDKTKSDEIYFDILKDFFKEYKIVHQTKNDRWYFDEKKQDFILDKRWDVVGKSSGNDILSGVYSYKKIDDLALSKEEIKSKFLDFCEKYSLKNCDKEVNKIPDKNNRIVLSINYDIAVQNFTKYFVKSNILTIDSKIHTFEDGQKTFQSMLKQPKNYKIDKWNALIYWFGGRVQRFYNFSYFIYPNSSNLKALANFKEFLKIADEKMEYRDEKGKLITTNSNIDFFNQLSNDGIFNKNFYISKSE